MVTGQDVDVVRVMTATVNDKAMASSPYRRITVPVVHQVTA
ncbi:hypothetical protein [Streptomyces bauhiniae]|nr:hypothetical protein [Streptomyces bauhiniae]